MNGMIVDTDGKVMKLEGKKTENDGDHQHKNYMRKFK